MRIFPYGIVLAVFAGAILVAPPRTARYSFPRSPSETHKAKEEPQSVEKRVGLPAAPPVKKNAAFETPMPVKPASPAASSSAAQAAPPAPAAPTTADLPIDLRSVVVVKCLFKDASGNQVTAYGSGVMVGEDGYVLTARHVVDTAYTYRITGGKQGLQEHVLDSCRIAVPPDGVKTPSIAAIRAINPFTPVSEFAYVAQVALVPPELAEGGMSEGEYDFADSALLRITSAVNGDLSRSFVVSPMKIFELPARGDEVVSFGFPSGVPSYGNNFYLQGSVGEIKDIVGGDRFFKDQPVGMTATMETIGGRSGSPVFWHGYVVGIISSKEDYSRNTAISAIFPLARFAQGAGIAVFR